MASKESASSEKSQLVHTSENAKDVESRLNKYAQDAITQTVERYLQYIKFKSFKETYPKIYAENKTHLKEIHSQFLMQLKDNFLDDAKEICKSSDLQNSLYLLDELITKYKDRIGKESWRPSGIPSKDLRDSLHQVKLKQKKCLEFHLQTLITENESIEKFLKENHQEILNNKRNIDRLNKDLKQHFQDLNDRSLVCLEKEIASNLEQM